MRNLALQWPLWPKWPRLLRRIRDARIAVDRHVDFGTPDFEHHACSFWLPSVVATSCVAGRNWRLSSGTRHGGRLLQLVHPINCKHQRWHTAALIVPADNAACCLPAILIGWSVHLFLASMPQAGSMYAAQAYNGTAERCHARYACASLGMTLYPTACRRLYEARVLTLHALMHAGYMHLMIPRAGRMLMLSQRACIHSVYAPWAVVQ